MVVVLREYWPGVPTGERETLERVTRSLSKIGIASVKVPVSLSDNEEIGLIDPMFVLDLHYDSPAITSAFSVGAIWSPLDYYTLFDNGNSLRTQLSHDLFVAANPLVAKGWLEVLRPDYRFGILPLNHTVSRDSIRDSRQDISGRVFYAGIGWDRSSSGAQRHEEFFRAMDSSGVLILHGAEKLGDGTRPWKSYKSYMGELPFDGLSVFEAINRSGFGLAFSSPSHRASQIASNRVFETIAAGAIPIVEENLVFPFNLDGGIVVASELEASEASKFIAEEVSRLSNDWEERSSRVRALQGRLEQGFTFDTQLEAIIDRVRELRRINLTQPLTHIISGYGLSQSSRPLTSGGLDSLAENPVLISFSLFKTLTSRIIPAEEWIVFSSDKSYLETLQASLVGVNLDAVDVIHASVYDVQGEKAVHWAAPPITGDMPAASVALRSSLLLDWLEQSKGLASVGSLLRAVSLDSEVSNSILSHLEVRKLILDRQAPANISINGLCSNTDAVVLPQLARMHNGQVSDLAKLLLLHNSFAFDSVNRQSGVGSALFAEISAMSIRQIGLGLVRLLGKLLRRHRKRK